ncbi:cytochrome c family protein [Candidatus Latescibacterota bacterium]
MTFLALLLLCIGTFFSNVGAQSVEQRGAYYVGCNTCAQCHKVQYDSFQKSAHNEAYNIIKNYERFLTMVKDGTQGSCLRCHATGYGVKGGFVDEATTPDFAKVSCEACHSPGSDHVAVITSDIEKKHATIQRVPNCGSCHTRRNIHSLN